MANSYPVGLVGERAYQDAIALLEVGERLYPAQEASNPHDAKAVAVERHDGTTVGYLARDSWIRAVIADEDGSAILRVQSINRTEGLRGVVVSAVVDPEAELRVRRYSAPERAARANANARKIGKAAGAGGGKAVMSLLKAMFKS